MAKPSATNIQPPSQTTVWTPPRTTWTLDNLSQWSEAENTLKTAADHGDVTFDSMIGSINLPLSHALDGVDLHSYDYVFFGVNGGLNETVTGKTDAAGVIVTGNGIDSIVGGNKGDVVFAGNGKDIVHGGNGNDILFGENGADQLFGDADNGTASVTQGEVTVTVNLIEKIADGTIADGFGQFVGKTGDTYQDNQGSLMKEGVYEDSGHLFSLFSFDPGDEAPTDVLNDVHIYVYTYDDGFVNPQYLGDWTVAENKMVYFSVDITENPGGKHVVVFNGAPTQSMLDDPQGNNWMAQRPSDKLADITTTGAGTFQFVAGDELVGGNGPDQFVYDAAEGTNNVDRVWDYNQSSGSYDPLEGDTLRLKNAGTTNVADLQFTAGHDINGDGNNDLVIVFGDNHAVGFVGISDISQLNIQFG
jgi:Ca2+-binding RTX toxin-like protein